jgi:prepilin signal peptidase PulO-like enzyme (type II secretory pathway)
MELLLILLCVLLGAVWGSFLGAWMYRFDKPLLSMWDRSRCTLCTAILKWHDLVPVVSFLWLRGKCRSCGGAFSSHYAWREAGTAVVFGVSAWAALAMYGFDLKFLAATVCVLIACTTIFFFDAYFSIVFPWVVVGCAVISLWYPIATHAPLFTLAHGALLGAGFFLAQWVVSRGRWIGMGDVWIGLYMGVLLGFPRTVAALMVAYVSGAAVSVIMLALKRWKYEKKVPFGAFLAPTVLGMWLWEDLLVRWYLGLLHY